MLDKLAFGIAVVLGLGWGQAELRNSWLKRDALEISNSRAKSYIRSLETAQGETARMQKAKDEAEQLAEKRRQENQQIAGDLGSELGGLRDDLARASQRTGSNPTCEAANKRADTAGELLEACAGRYQELARKAQGHVEDVLMFDGAWPTSTASSIKTVPD